MSEPLLQVKNLNVTLKLPAGNLHAVRGVDFEISRGETLGLVGESGSGKSMTALALARLLPASARISADSIRFDGVDLRTVPDRQFASQISSQRISIIFQDPMSSLNPVYTIGRQLTETMLIHGQHDRQEATARALELLARVGIPDPRSRLGQYPHQLSGGQRQRVMIALALMNQPELIIADEPTTALDVTVQAEILRLLRDLQEQFGMALMLITHDLGVVSRTADKVAVMYAGQIVEYAPVALALDDARHPYTRGLLACVPDSRRQHNKLSAIGGIVPSLTGEITGCGFANRCKLSRPECHTGQIAMLSLSGQHAARCLPDVLSRLPAADVDSATPDPVTRPTPQSAAQHTPLISARSVCRSFQVKRGLFARARQLQAVSQVDLDIPPGKTLALVGESGCGKSTLAMMLLGQQAPDSGEIRLDGRAIKNYSTRERARLVQAIFQDPYASLNPRRTIEQIIRRPLDVLGIGPEHERGNRVRETLSLVGLPERVLNSYPGQISGGQRQRVAIARAIIVKPRLIICDEPTSALDVSVQSQIMNLLIDLTHKLNLTYLLITHDLGVVDYMADEIAVMYLGQIVEQGPARKILEDASHPYTRRLLNAVLDLNTSGGLPAGTGDGAAPNPLAVPSGCRFHPRCEYARPDCAIDAPPIRANHGHLLRCVLEPAALDADAEVLSHE